MERLTAAFERDVAAIIAMMTEDAWLTMPPLPLEYQGRIAAEFLTATAFRPGWTARLIPARANGQPAFGFYVRDPDTGSYYTVGLIVLTLSGTKVAAMTRFDPAVLPQIRASVIPQQLNLRVSLQRSPRRHRVTPGPPRGSAVPRAPAGGPRRPGRGRAWRRSS